METQTTDYPTMLRAYAAANADEMLRPITTAEAAEALGFDTAEALQKMRSRNKQQGLPVPPGFAFVPGLGWRYPSKLELLLWAREYYESRRRDPGAEGGEA
jgi:hypothetical protein